jgi:hypothetical protein
MILREPAFGPKRIRKQVLPREKAILFPPETALEKLGVRKRRSM